MTSRLSTVIAVLRKDILVLWPLILVSLVLPIAIGVFPAEASMRFGPRPWALGLGMVASAFMIVSLFHQDSASDPRQDWLNRPITPTNLLLAKGLFLMIFLVAPHYAAAVSAELLSEHTLGEALPAGLRELRTLVVMMAPFIMIGIVTSSLIEALIAGAIPVLIGLGITMTLLGARPYTVDVTGLEWISAWFSFAVGVAAVVAAFWLLYWRKAVLRARLILAIGVAVILTDPIGYAARPAFALQRAMLAQPALAEPIRVTTKIDCRDEARPGERLKTPLRDDPSALRFETWVKPTSAPAGWAVALDRARGHYVSADGSPLDKQHSAVLEPRPRTRFLPGNRGWLASGRDQAALAPQGARLQLRYDITLLRPLRSASLPIDGVRRYLPGFGYCAARMDGDVVRTRCFAPVHDATVVSVSAGAAPGASKFSYGPAVFPSLLAKLDMSAHVAPGAKTAVLTAYRAEAHAEKTDSLPLADIAAARACPRAKAS